MRGRCSCNRLEWRDPLKELPTRMSTFVSASEVGRIGGAEMATDI